MKLEFESLNELHSHKTYLAKVFNTEDVFLVGGCIRDLLLGVTKNPKDIDLAVS